MIRLKSSFAEVNRPVLINELAHEALNKKLRHILRGHQVPESLDVLHF